jgi:hypothetical protein
VAGPEFRRDLYRGAATDYERFRMILADCGFATGESWTLPVSHEWSVEALTGFVFSTSVLSRAALGGQAGAFAAELERDLLGCVPGGRFRQVISFACELARRPG